MAFLALYVVELSVTLFGARFQILIESLTQLFLVVVDFPMLIGFPMTAARVEVPTSGIDCRAILSGYPCTFRDFHTSISLI